MPPDGVHGVTVLDLPVRWDELEDPTRLRLQFEGASRLADGRYPVQALRLRDEVIRAKVDQCSLATAEAFARRLTPLHTVSGVVETTGAEAPGDVDFMELLALGDVHDFDPDAGLAAAARARPAAGPDRHSATAAAVVHLDIKESAQQGMGPHGLVIGATGSGKSEFLRTLVLGLAMTHSPEHLNLVLVDFKGGATFAGMSELPHVSAVITNLAQELTLVDRMQDALSGEMVRRQELLREAGNFASIRDYEKARAAGEDLAPLPSLFIVVDEFSEMLSAKPEFIDLFVAIGRLGRSLGLHLLLASQRLEEGRLRGLESHLSYRVGLRTFSAAGVPRGARRTRRLRAAGRSRPRLPQARPDHDAAVQGGVRLRAAVGPGAGTPRRGRQAPGDPAVHDLGGAEARRARSTTRAGRRSRSTPATSSRCSTSRSATWSATARRPTRSGCRRWTCPDTLDELMPDLAADPGSGWSRASGARSAGSSCRSAPWTGRASSAATPSASTSAARPATSPSSAARAAARARCCASSSPAWR